MVDPEYCWWTPFKNDDPCVMYLKETKVNLLTPDEEVQLAQGYGGRRMYKEQMEELELEARKNGEEVSYHRGEREGTALPGEAGMSGQRSREANLPVQVSRRLLGVVRGVAACPGSRQRAQPGLCHGGESSTFTIAAASPPMPLGGSKPGHHLGHRRLQAPRTIRIPSGCWWRPSKVIRHPHCAPSGEAGA